MREPLTHWGCQTKSHEHEILTFRENVKLDVFLCLYPSICAPVRMSSHLNHGDGGEVHPFTGTEALYSPYGP